MTAQKRKHRPDGLWGYRRDTARVILRRLAQEAPEPLTGRQIHLLAGATVEAWVAVEWLMQHRFLVVAPGCERKPRRYELSEQAIRWLDWAGFCWREARARVGSVLFADALGRGIPA